MNKDLYEKGQKLRRHVLGDAYVDAAQKKTTDFNRPFQELVTEYVWGTLWSRDGLDKRTRALINIAMLTAMGRIEEVKLYLKAAPNVGVTQDDVREVLMQTAIYCGIPAALDSFRVAQEIYADAPPAKPKKAKGGKKKSGKKSAAK
jgi:4-carboxymuconolactone decarboxylase